MFDNRVLIANWTGVAVALVDLLRRRESFEAVIAKNLTTPSLLVHLNFIAPLWPAFLTLRRVMPTRKDSS